MAGRSVDEWIGASPDAKVPARVRARIFLREEGRCHLSGRKITAADEWDLDHRTPLSMGGEHRESNLFPAIRDKHREKTAAEAGPRAKADRVRLKHIGAWPKTKRPLRSRGFGPSRQAVRS